MNRRILIFASCLISALAAYSCENIDTEDTPHDPYYLEFVHESDATLEFNADFEGKYEMILKTNVPKKHLKVTKLDDQKWCSADIRKDGGALIITPGFAVSEDVTARFSVEVIVDGEGIEPLEFSVTRLHQVIVPSITLMENGVELEGENAVITKKVSGNAQMLSFTVKTSASLWKLEYDTFGDQEWVTVDKASGADGATVTITLAKNETGSTRNQNFRFSPVIAGTDVAVNLVVIQRAASSIESVVVREYDKTTMDVGNVIADKSQISLPADASEYCFDVEIVGAGGVEPRFTAPGGNEFAYDGEWIFGGTYFKDSTTESQDKYYYVKAVKNTGAARSMDVVLTDTNGIELFRFTVIQAGI